MTSWARMLEVWPGLVVCGGVAAAIQFYWSNFQDSALVDIVGGMVTLVFSNGSQIVVNLQKPLHEIWLASRSGGYHYKYESGCWQDTKGQGEFFAGLSRDASAQAGRALVFGDQKTISS